MNNKFYVITRIHKMYNCDDDQLHCGHSGWKHVTKDEIPLLFSSLCKARSQMTCLVADARVEDSGFSDNEVESNDEGTHIIIATSANIWEFVLTEVIADMTSSELNTTCWNVNEKRQLHSRADVIDTNNRVNVNRGW